MYSFLSDSSRQLADRAVAYVGVDPDRFGELCRICIAESYPLNMRAGRAMVLCAEQNVFLSLPHLSRMLQHLVVTQTDGVKRAFLKLLRPHFTALSEGEQGILIDLCFRIVESQSEAIAVKAYCIDILVESVKVYPDLKQEVLSFLEMFDEKLSSLEYAPALRASVRNSVKALNRKARSSRKV